MNHYITQEGLEKLKEELKDLKAKRQGIAERIEEAKSLGDLSENAEYAQAREEQSFNEGRVVELEELVKNATIITHQTGDTISIGCTIETESDAVERVFTIVGSEEASPLEGRISNESPLGKAFLGHRAGETVEVKIPKGMVSYKIRAIK